MDKRSECNYRDKCYRQKYDHFEKFKHAHLDELLERIGSHEIHVPFGYIPNISFSTLKLQLEIERKIRETKISDESEEPESKRVRASNQKEELSVSSLLDRDDDLFAGTSDKVSTSSPRTNAEKNGASPKSLKKTPSPNSSQSKANQKLDKPKNPSTSRLSIEATPGTSSDTLSNCSYSSQTLSQSGPSKKNFEKQKVNAARHSANMREADKFRDQIKSQMNMNIGDKLRATSPYNILYTTLQSSPNYKPDNLAITFPELLDSPLGLLEDSLLINFMIQFGWLLACYFTMGHSNKQMTLLYGESDTEFGTKFNKFLKHAKIKPPTAFGSHHTKMMIFQYLDKSIRVVICTANLIESDWVNRTQGVWISDKCEEMLPDETGGESRTNFKRDLLAYLKSYHLSMLDPWIEKVQKADMSHINVFFIASIPGSHKVSEGKWGQARVRSVLKSHAPLVEENKYKIITQISSIGSLGPNPDSWLMNDILTTFGTTIKPLQPFQHRPSLSVIYPSFSDVESSIDGLLGGGCLPYSSTTHRKQEWLSNYLHHWKTDTIGRTKAVPHIKSYTRVSQDHSRISYFLLTSANLSKAAWGTISKTQTLNILSYEVGVLFLPEFVFGDGVYFPLQDEVTESGVTKPKFVLPYDLPLVPYGINDIPWFIDNLPS